MTQLSVNINKFATLRNARGKNNPNLLEVAKDCEQFGAQGITIHPRPDQRHIRFQDALSLKNVVTTTFNIEGNPQKYYMDLVLQVCPAQATLVPDAQDAITSNAGWDVVGHKVFLQEVITELHAKGISTSIFVDPVIKQIEAAAAIGTDRIELYTESYAKNYYNDKEKAISDYVKVARLAKELGLGINAGHDLNLDNLAYFHQQVPGLLEVSIGHALVCDALYLGLENVIQLYKRQLS